MAISPATATSASRMECLKPCSITGNDRNPAISQQSFFGGVKARGQGVQDHGLVVDDPLDEGGQQMAVMRLEGRSDG